MIFDEIDEASEIEKVTWLQNGLIAQSTGGGFPGGDSAYARLRLELLGSAIARNKIPEYVKKCRELGQFWQFIKLSLRSYAERRSFIWESFHDLIDSLESADKSVFESSISDVLITFNVETVYVVWRKSLERIEADPEGAITAARALIESVCKHILDEAAMAYSDDIELPKLWHMTAKKLNLAPQQHDEKVFKVILGSCQSVVNSLGALRNRIGDAHGAGKRKVRPKSRHARLAVNLAGSMAVFLVSTWKERTSA